MKKAITTLIVGGMVFMSVIGISEAFYYTQARAGAEAECVACQTIKTNYCGGIGNICATKWIEFTCKRAGACESCVNAGSSYIDNIASTDKNDGARKKTNKTDCGNKATGGTCTWSTKPGGGCYCGGATDSGQVGGCGQKDNYETCTPPKK